MAEWALLLLLVPAVVVPVVLLLGFAGCDLIFKLHRATSIDSAVATSRNSILVEWSNDTDTDSFRLEVTELPEATLLPQIIPPASPFEVTGLDQGTTYRFRVTAVDGDDTYTSLPVLADTLAVALDTSTIVGSPGTQNVESLTIVQRIDSGLTASGSRVRLILAAPDTGAASIDRLYLSQAAATGDPYDSAGDLTPVFDISSTGQTPLILQGTAEIALPIIDYALDMTQPLLLAADFTPGFPSLIRAPLPFPSGTIFFQVFQPGLQEAGIPGGNRSPGYASALNSIALVTRIEVG